jgi:hypothetical protein
MSSGALETRTESSSSTSTPSPADREDRAEVGIASHPAQHLGARLDLVRDEHRTAAEAACRFSCSLG